MKSRGRLAGVLLLAALATAVAARATPPPDGDGDGVPDATDNCPTIANPGQEDLDADLKGDVCDPCPSTSNPGNLGCPASIYSIKGGLWSDGTTVQVLNALVTGKGSNGFFLQVKSTDAGYAGPNNSGIFVFQTPPPGAMNVGDRVDVNGTATIFDSRWEMNNVTSVGIDSSGEGPPTPVEVLPADVVTGGVRAVLLEGVVVSIPCTTVGSIASPSEFLVDSGLRVSDFLSPAWVFPTVGEEIAPLEGILDRRNGDSKLEPRGASDLGAVTGSTPESLVAFGPSPTHATIGQVAAQTFPRLTARICPTAPSDTFVTIASDDPLSLAVTGGGVTVATGETEATVLVDGLQLAGNVILTAQLASTELDASVSVLDHGTFFDGFETGNTASWGETQTAP